MNEEWSVEVFHDGDCPLCEREINMLRRLDRRGEIRFTDIAAADFVAQDHGKTHAEFMARIQARTADGEWLDGVEVFRQLYGAIGLRPVMGLTRLPGVSHALEAAYDVFAKNRLRLTGRAGCDTTCAVRAAEHPS